ALPHMIAHGSPQLIDRYVRPTLAGGMIGSLAVTEPGGGSDVAGITARAVRHGDRDISNGAKTFITSGGRADFVQPQARTSGATACPPRGAPADRATAASRSWSSTPTPPASPPPGRCARWAGTARTPPSCPTSTSRCRPTTSSERRAGASSTSPSSSWWSGSSWRSWARSEEHTSELQSSEKLVCRLLLEIKNTWHY